MRTDNRLSGVLHVLMHLGEHDAVTLRDVYEALGSPSVLAMGNRTEAPHCVVEQAVNAALAPAFHAAEALLIARFGEVTLATPGADVRMRLAARAGSRSTTRSLDLSCGALA